MRTESFGYLPAYIRQLNADLEATKAEPFAEFIALRVAGGHPVPAHLRAKMATGELHAR